MDDKRSRKKGVVVRLNVGSSFLTHPYTNVFDRYDSVGMIPRGDLFELGRSTIGTVLEVQPARERERYMYRALFSDGRVGWMHSDNLRTVLL